MTRGGRILGVITKKEKRGGLLAALAALLICGSVIPLAAGCGQLTCDFDEMWSAAGDPGSPQVNPENYERIEMYMTYEEVVAILGGPGYCTWQYTLAGHTTVNYDWVGRYGYHISVSFTDGVVTDKSWWVPEEPETGEPGSGEPARRFERRRPDVVKRWEPPATPGVTLANFERIRTGLTYRQVVAAFGSEGTLKGSRWIGKAELKEYEWRNNRGGFATIDFRKGRVCRKYQRGLK